MPVFSTIVKSLSKTVAVPLRVLISAETVLINSGLRFNGSETLAVKPPAPVIVTTSVTINSQSNRCCYFPSHNNSSLILISSKRI